MLFSKVFFINISLLITLAYLMNLGYKYIISRAQYRVKFIASVLLFILAGWVTMVFGLQVGENILFDLRFVPLLTAILVYRNPAVPFLIGIGIGLARLSFGVNDAAVAGFINLALLGVLAAGLNYWYHRSPKAFWTKVISIILLVNLMNAIHIGLFGVLDVHTYVTGFVPVTLPLGIVLSCFFLFILRDFYLELQRMQDLKQTNELLEKQAEALLEVTAAIEEKAAQVERASQYKSDFLANMSHELKTPLNSIILLSQLMVERSGSNGQLSEEDQQYIQIIHSSGKELLQQINDILDLSKVEAGKMDILEEIVSVGEIPEILHHQFQVMAQQKGIRFEIRKEEGLPDLLRTDGMRVHQILKNLLSNAFKFTHEGQVTLELARVSGENERNGPREWLAFIVKDTGIGIAEEKQQRIFDAFHQADEAITRQYGGTGLGLSISLQLAKLLGGRLTVASTLGKGSQFTLLLPLDTEPLELGGEQDIFMKLS